jgi:hypothetical protein
MKKDTRSKLICVLPLEPDIPDKKQALWDCTDNQLILLAIEYFEAALNRLSDQEREIERLTETINQIYEDIEDANIERGLLM